MTAEGQYELVNPQEGDTVQSLLHYVNFDTSFLHNAYRKRLKAAALTLEQQRAYLQALEAGLIGHTYLET
jgi:arginine decarboxylase